MVYIKVMQGEEIITAEAHDSPVYVCRQTKNDILVRCSEPKAQGILSLDGSTVYQLDGKASLGLEDGCTAYSIYLTDYEEIIAGLGDTGDTDEEDATPEVPEGTTEEQILTRAELTAKVAELEEKLLATEILLGVSE